MYTYSEQIMFYFPQYM